MRKVSKGLLVALLCVSSAQFTTYTEKNFLMQRPMSDDLAMEYSSWHKHFNKLDEHKKVDVKKVDVKKEEIKKDEKLGGCFQSVPFYAKSTNKSDLADYFGYQDDENIYGYIFVGHELTDGATSLSPLEVLWDPAAAVGSSSELNAKANFNPTREAFGLRLDYHQSFDHVLENLFAKVSVPVVYVKTNMGINYTGTITTQTLPGRADTVSLLDYLAGNVTSDYQTALTHAKINGARTKVGVADIHLTLGYKLLKEENQHLTAALNLVVPTSNKPSGEYLFEPVYGNAGHLGLGATIDGVFDVWSKKEDEMSLDLVFAAKYKYLFKSREVRTLGIKDMSSRVIDSHGFYKLGGMVGDERVFPLANILTRDVEVTPGGQFEALANLSFAWQSFHFDFGYNLFAKEREVVDVNNWKDHLYGSLDIASSYNPATDSAGFLSGDANNNTLITSEYLDTWAITTPAQVTHKVHATVNYEFEDWKYPMMFGFGGSYEFLPGRNAGLEGYAIWAKAGVSF